MTARAAGWDVHQFAFLTVEKNFPHAVHRHNVDAALLTWGTSVVEELLTEIAEAEATGVWSTGWGHSSSLTLPTYLMEDEDV